MRTDRARWVHGSNLLLSTPREIIHKVGSWDEALRKAALKLPDERAPRVRQKRAPSLPDLMERFHDHYGVQPTFHDLQEFARGNGIPYPDPRRVKFSVGRKERLAQRRANGLPAPKVVGRPVGRRPRNSRPAPPAPTTRATWARRGPASAVSGSIASASGRARTASRASHGTWSRPRDRGPRSAGTAAGRRRRRAHPYSPPLNCTADGKRCASLRRKSCDAATADGPSLSPISHSSSARFLRGSRVYAPNANVLRHLPSRARLSSYH